MTRRSSKKKSPPKKKDEELELKDFVASVDDVMQKQAEEYPPIKQVHAKLSPDWSKSSELISQLLSTQDEVREKELIEKVVQQGDISTRVLLELLLNLKKEQKNR